MDSDGNKQPLKRIYCPSSLSEYSIRDTEPLRVRVFCKEFGYRLDKYVDGIFGNIPKGKTISVTKLRYHFHESFIGDRLDINSPKLTLYEINISDSGRNVR